MSQPTALIIEDSPTQARIITKMIENLGWATYHCPTIREGCETLTGMAVQAIFLDVFVGQHNGLLHVDRLRKLAPSASILIMTAGNGRQAIDETLTGARKAGADYVLRKPFTETLLREILQTLFSANTGREGRKTHILIIDDSQTVRSFTTQALQDRGYRISQAASMEEAFANIDIAHVDLVLCDVFLPGMGGLKGMRTIRSAWPKVKIVSMSAGFNEQVSQAEALNATRRIGITAQISKPFTREDIQEVLQAVLEEV